MARNSELPGFERKRKVLFSEKGNPDQLRQMGQQFLEAGHFYDALEFFERADARELVRQVAEKAIDAGDTPLLMRAKRILSEETSEEEWSQTARHAEDAGLLAAARLAHEQAGHDDEVARLSEKLTEAAAEVEPQGTRTEG